MKVAGSVRPPGDKSISHRALFVSALARSRLLLRGVLTAADTRSSARVLRQLGTSVGPLREGCTVTVRGRRWSRPESTLNCGNSGTAARFLLGSLAGHRFEARVDGDTSLRRRPMRRVTRPLIQMGAAVREEQGDGLPLRIKGGRLRPIEYQSPVASAQLKSALLLAGLTAGVPVTVTEPKPSRDHTERLFRHLGFDVQIDGTTIAFTGPGADWPVTAERELAVPGDASSAAFLTGLATLANDGEVLIENVGVNPTRTGFLRVLERMGGRVDWTEPREVTGEPVADLLVRPAQLRATEIAAAEIPGLIDEVPILAVLAARAEGESVFRSVGELRVKESDRLSLIASNLRSIGVDADVVGDDLVVVGSDRPLRGRVETAHDHRLAMAFAVLGETSGCCIELSERNSVSISYPRFFRDLRSVVDHG